jgi:hypothetical protein
MRSELAQAKNASTSAVRKNLFMRSPEKYAVFLIS